MFWVSAVFESLTGAMASQSRSRPGALAATPSGDSWPLDWAEMDVFCESELVSGAAAMTLSHVTARSGNQPIYGQNRSGVV